MKFCTKCGAKLNESGKFCVACGAAVTATAAEAPAEQPKPVALKEKKPKKSHKKLIAILVTILVVAILGTSAFFVLQWYFSPEQRSLRALDRGDYEEALEIMDGDKTILQNDKLISQLKERLATIKADFTANTMDYTTAQTELEAIAELEIEDIAEKLAETETYVNQLNQSRADFATAESFFTRGDYPEAMEYYKKVIEADSNYQTAKLKITESGNLYRDKMLSSAAEYAANGQYSSAIATLQSALTVLPEDTQVTQQIALYEKDLAVQLKTQALNDAAAYAQIGDYISAMNTISAILETQSGDAELNVAYAGYCDQYVDSVLVAAEKTQAESGYVEAMAQLQAGIGVVGSDTRLEGRLTAYQNSYVAEILEQADALMKEKKYDEAISLCNTALRNVPRNAQLNNKIAEIEGKKPKNFVDVCEPYESSYYEKYATGRTFYMAGQAWTNGFTIGERGYAYCNLGRKYTLLSFTVGHIDGSSMRDRSLSIYLDGVLYREIQIKADAMPQEIEIDVNNVSQIQFVITYAYDNANYGFANVVIQ